ncbi:MAG: hypothetical protein HKN39_01545 [Flavobacteriales bacterium]|nr:hypothetical protein [Flavobacteriales bacterium]
MKVKTLVELLTLSSSIYYLAKDTQVLDRLKEMSEKGKEGLNQVMNEPLTDEDGNELEFVDKIILKTGELKDQLEERVEEMVAAFYKKINVAHLDEIKALKEKLERSDDLVALLEARVNRLEEAGK